jgi:hypothetical protein
MQSLYEYIEVMMSSTCTIGYRLWRFSIIYLSSNCHTIYHPILFCIKDNRTIEGQSRIKAAATTLNSVLYKLATNNRVKLVLHPSTVHFTYSQLNKYNISIKILNR